MPDTLLTYSVASDLANDATAPFDWQNGQYSSSSRSFHPYSIIRCLLLGSESILSELFPDSQSDTHLTQIVADMEAIKMIDPLI